MVSQIPLGPLGVFGKGKWEFIVKAENGSIYGIPNRGARVLKISPVDRSIICIGPDFGSFPSKWGQGAIGGDGKIYCPPASHSKALCIDPETDTVEAFGTDFGAAKPLKWYSAVKADDGKLYCPPMNFNRVLCIDPWTKETEIWGPRLINHKLGWTSGALAADGRIYCAPSNAPQVLMIDPMASTAHPIGPDLGLRKSKYDHCVKANDGAIYCSPTLEAQALRIKVPKNSKNAAIQIEYIGQHLPTKGKAWGTGALGHDGRIYYPPRMGLQILCIDPYKSTSELIGPEMTWGKKSESKWAGAVEGNDGLLYCVPCDAGCVLGIDIDTIQNNAQRKAKSPSSNSKPSQITKSERARRVRVVKSLMAFRQTQLISFVQSIASGLTGLVQKGLRRLVPFAGQEEVESVFNKEALPFKVSAHKKKGQDERTEESVSTAGDDDDNESVASDESASSEEGSQIDAALDDVLCAPGSGLFHSSQGSDGNRSQLTLAALQSKSQGEGKHQLTRSATTGSSCTSSRASSSRQISSLSSSASEKSSSLSSSVASTPLRTPTDSTATLQRISGLMAKLSSKGSSGAVSPLTPATASKHSPNGALALKPVLEQYIAAVPEEGSEDKDFLPKTLNDDDAISFLREKLGHLHAMRSKKNGQPCEASQFMPMTDQSLLMEKSVEDAMLLCAPSASSTRRPCSVCGVGDTCAVQ